MSSKVGLILSLLFVSLFVAFGIDMINVQFAYSSLDSKCVAISYRISKHGSVDEALVNALEEEYQVEFVCTGNCQPLFGDVVTYQVSTYIDALVISKSAVKITIERTAIIGYYA